MNKGNTTPDTTPANAPRPIGKKHFDRDEKQIKLSKLNWTYQPIHL